MFECWIFDNVEYSRRKNYITMATYIYIKGYKTRQNLKKAITCSQRTYISAADVIPEKLKLCSFTTVRLFFLVLVYVFNFG